MPRQQLTRASDERRRARHNLDPPTSTNGLEHSFTLTTNSESRSNVQSMSRVKADQFNVRKIVRSKPFRRESEELYGYS